MELYSLETFLRRGGTDARPSDVNLVVEICIVIRVLLMVAVLTSERTLETAAACQVLHSKSKSCLSDAFDPEIIGVWWFLSAIKSD